MFCYQCEQTAGGTGCTKIGACGKDSQTAQLQDLLVYAAKGIAMYARQAALLGAGDTQVNRFIIEALFSTVTNVNFDPERLKKLLTQATAVKNKAKNLYHQACKKAGRRPVELSGPAMWEPAQDTAGLLVQAADVGIEKQLANLGPDAAGLQNLITYGLKGSAAYLDHAMLLGVEDTQVYDFFSEALDFLCGPKATDINELVRMALEVGRINLRVMELLDKANTDAYGHPEPTTVRITPVKGKAILVSGHDLKDLAELLKQTQGRGVNVYTHGEMLPCHAYPGLKKYKHLVGNYGGAWQDQHREFDQFPGAILMTTNCLQKPKDSYNNRIFTTGLVAWPGVKHIADKNFTPVIESALASGGFRTDTTAQFITVGFARNAVMNVAGRVIEAVKAGKIRHFFLIGGCDGAKSGRNYYTDFALSVPQDCVILTLACGKYRFNKLQFGDIDGIPRLLDVGQCNDAYSAIQIATALAEAFGCDVNSLPLSLVLSWYEQKAVCILLTLLHLGIKNIRLGPSLPIFISPAVLNVLIEKFGLGPVKTAKDDLAAILG